MVSRDSICQQTTNTVFPIAIESDFRTGGRMINMLSASLKTLLECLRRFTSIVKNAQRTTPFFHTESISERGGHLRHSGKMIIEPLASQPVIRISGMSI